MHLLIIGGSDAGISAGLRAREIDPSWDVTLVVADAFPNYSICGLPFFLSGEVPDWHSLAHRTLADLEEAGLTLLLDHTALAIHPGDQAVTVAGPDGATDTLAYDRLVIGTGATPVQPPIIGLDAPGVFSLHAMASAFALDAYIAAHQPRSAIIIGAGYIGLEMADALTLRGLAVTLVSRPHTVLPTVDPPFGRIVAAELTRHGVAVCTGINVAAVARAGGGLTVSGSGGFARTADLVLVAVGVAPATALAAAAGIETGAGGGIRVNRRMETAVPDIYAAGDCAETWHRLLGRPVYLPLGTTAHKQGRVAGENAVGGSREFAGSLGTQVVKVFDLAIARTGLREDEAVGFDPFTVETTAYDHKVYYPDARDITVRITGDRRRGRLLGAQMLGDWRGEIAKRIDIYATALFHGMTIEGVSDLDLSYTPPFGSPWDAVQMAAQAWSRGART